mmetsp:Transcript_84659/g.193038  ORF Transcript_84659/g.193038 Transcript_84659/m.193038 type:complete len:266 (+) Transcript_84659:253-1050(+)
MSHAEPLRRVIQAGVPRTAQQPTLSPEAPMGTAGETRVLSQVSSEGHRGESSRLRVALLGIRHLGGVCHLNELFVTHAHIIPALHQLTRHNIPPQVPRRLHGHLEIVVCRPHPPEHSALSDGPGRGGRHLGQTGGGHPGALQENRVVDADAGGGGGRTGIGGVVDVGDQLRSNPRERETAHRNLPTPAPGGQLGREQGRQRRAGPSRGHRLLQLFRPMQRIKAELRLHLPRCGGDGGHRHRRQPNDLSHRAGDGGGDEAVLQTIG